MLAERRLDALSFFLMSDSTLSMNVAAFPTDLFGQAASSLHELPNGNLLVKGLKVFRAGSFSDSRGRRRTWQSADLMKMVENFKSLRESGIFPNVPVRLDHSFSMADVGGYFESLSTDGQYLYGDIELIHPKMVEAYKLGLLRGRSLEIGKYETNDEVEYEPVVMGVAFVDLPAVEGLYSKYADGDSGYTPMADKEMKVVEFTKAELDWAVAATYAQAIEDARKSFPPAGKDKDDEPFSFSLKSEKVSDYAKVQAELDRLYEREANAAKAERVGFVESLVAGKRIMASQKDNFAKHVESLDDAQFEAFRGLYADAPVLPVLDNYSLGGENGNGSETPPGDNRTEVEKQRDLYEEIIKQHRRSGMTEDEIAATPTYKKLHTLNAGSAGK